MERLRLDIVSPEKELFQGEVDSVTLPGTRGCFSILPHHAPIVSSLGAGTLSYVVNGEEQTLEVLGGFVEMSNDEVSVCVETAV